MMQRKIQFTRAAVALAILPWVTSAGAAETSENPSIGEYTPVDLSSFYDLHADDSSQFGTWEVVPKGRQVFDGVPFDVNGMVRLFGRVPPPHRTIYRESVSGIEVGRRFDRLHLLHGTGWTTEDGEIIAHVVLHYSDGDEASFPIVYGGHVRDWWHRDLQSPGGVADPNSGVAWIGHHGVGLRLYRTSLKNPHPQKTVETLDIVSTRSAVTPAILSITAGPDVHPLRSALGKNISDEDDTILFQVFDEESGEAVPEAGLHLTYRTPSTYAYWGSFSGGPEGLAELTYPEGPLEILKVTVFARGWQPASVTWRPGDGEEIPLWHIIKLTKASDR